MKMNDSHYVHIDITEKGTAVKIRATRAEIVRALSSLVGDCVEENLLPDLSEKRISAGAKIGCAISAGIYSTKLSLCSMKKVYMDLIDALIAQLTNINETMKGEN